MVPPLRILLADADAATRSALGLLLRSKLGLLITDEVEDGPALLRLLIVAPPDLLLLDWSLPGRPDCETLLAARRTHPALRLAILSVDAAHAAAAEALGAVFIHKASPASDVLDQLRSLVEPGPVQ